MSVKQARKEIGPREFLRWQASIILEEEDAVRKEWEQRSKSDFYLSRIAYEVFVLRMSFCNAFGGKVEYEPLDSFLLKVPGSDGGEKVEVRRVSPELPRVKRPKGTLLEGMPKDAFEQMERSKAVRLGMFGIDPSVILLKE